MKQERRRITMLTAYDATFARLLDRAGIDVLLVGDSLGMVVQGRANTLAVTIGDVAYHCAAVSRAVERAHVVGDMPFLSYHVSDEEAVRNAGRLLLEGGAHSIKLEGGRERASTIAAIVRAQIPVMAHIGLTPQSVHVQGGFKVQGRSDVAARKILDDARAVQDAGAYSLVLEGIPAELAAQVTESLDIPTIGIGAGPRCDGQVLVIYDLLGLQEDFKPKFVKRYAEMGRLVREAVSTYAEEVRSGAFPDDAHAFHGAPARAAAAKAPRANGNNGNSHAHGTGQGNGNGDAESTPRAAYGPVDVPHA
jgi:3-methyl-2-oxobutanoate hydroxymethyltransferase